MNGKTLAASVALITLLAGLVPAFAAQKQDEDQVQLGTSEVILDVIATDSKGRPITDLRADEVQVFESGDRMEMTSFGLVDRSVSSATGAPAGSAPLSIETSPFRGFNYVIVVVDRTSLNQQELKLTYDAGVRYVTERLGPNDVVSVFVAASRLVMVQNFTNNKDKLTKALAAACDRSSQVISVSASDRLALSVDVVSPAGPAGAPGASTGGGLGAALDQLNAIANDVNNTFDLLVSQFQAIALVTDLLALMKIYSPIPGRKSVLLYTEGFSVNDTVEGSFASLIGTANRNNFAFYTVDAAGLRPDSSRLNRSTAPAGGGTILGNNADPTLVDITGNSGLGRSEQSVRTAANGALNRLSVETSGVPLRNNNDLNRGFQAVESDLRSYYVLSYIPKDLAVDGKFRPIEVKVTRKGVDVRTRKGYYATPGGSGSVLLPFEQSVLEMLANSKPEARPSALPASARVERFRDGESYLLPIVVQLPASSLTAATPPPPDKKEKETATPPLNFELDMVVLVRDAKGSVVAKLARSFLYRSAKDDLARFQQLELTNSFTKPLALAPGTYKVALGLYDPNAEKGTVIERSLVLPQFVPGAAVVSSLVLSRDVEPIAAADQAKYADDPLVFDGKAMIVPNTTGRFLKSRGDRLVVFFRVYGAASKQYQVRMEFVKDGKPVSASKPADLPVTDASGRTAFAPSIPIDGLEPGSYLAHVVVIDPETTKPVADATGNFRIDP